MEGISAKQYTRLKNRNVYMKRADGENKPVASDTVTQNNSGTAADTLTLQENNSTNNKKKLKNILIGSGIALVAGSYAAVFYRKNIMEFVSNFIKKGYLKAENIKNRTHQTGTILETAYIKTARFLDKTLMQSQIFVNFSAMKDSFVNKVARFLRLGPLCDKMTQTWDRLATNAVLSNYKKCNKSFDKTNKMIFDKIDEIRKTEDLQKIITIDGKNYTVGEILGLIKQNMTETHKMYNKNFSEEAFQARKQILAERLKGINEKFYDAYTSMDYYKKGDFTRFTVEEWLAPIKASYQDYLLKNKSEISNNIDDKFFAAYKLLKNFDKIIAPQDTKSRETLKDIIHKLKEYRNLSGTNELTSREALTKEIETKIQAIITQIGNNPIYKEKAQKEITGLAENIKYTINAGQKGKLQETLTYLKAVLPRNEYLEIRRQVYKTSDKLNKITTAEGDLYFDKLRDITLGSALTDITFGMVSPLAMMGVMIAADDTRDERISTTLKLGIPLLGGVATSTALLFMLVAGGKAMTLATLSSLILNRLGTIADNKLKTHQEEKNPKLNTIVNNINTSSTFLASGGTSYFINQAAEKGVKTAEHYATEKIIKKLPLANKKTQQAKNTPIQDTAPAKDSTAATTV